MLKLNISKIVMSVALSGGLSVGSIFAPITSPEKVSAVAVPEYRTDLLSNFSISENKISGTAKGTGLVNVEVSYNGITEWYSSSIVDKKFTTEFIKPIKPGTLIKVRFSGEVGTQEETLTYGTPSKVIVYYQDENGNNLEDPSELNGYVGEAYNTTYSNMINGYGLYREPANKSGEYTSENQSVVYVYKKMNVPEISTRYLVLYVGDSWKTEDSFEAAFDQFRNSMKMSDFTINYDVDTTKAGNYFVSYYKSLYDNLLLGHKEDVIVLENKQSINGSDYTITVGDKTPETSNFQATATDKDGNPVEVTVDFSQADLNTAGTYDVLLTSSDGQIKMVKLTVKEKSNSKDEVVTPLNPTTSSSSAKGTKVTPTKTSPTSDSVRSITRNYRSDESLPTTGEKDSTSAIVAGILLIVIALLTFGFLKKKKK